LANSPVALVRDPHDLSPQRTGFALLLRSRFRDGVEPTATGGGGTPTGHAGAGEGGAPAELEAVPSEMHRLNATEYEATVSDRLGSTAALTSSPKKARATGSTTSRPRSGVNRTGAPLAPIGELLAL
jgi:hypothetical protein